MDLWGWFNERREDFRRTGDRERMRLVTLHHEGFALQETNPDGSYEIFTEGRNLAKRLDEPWFVYFYDVWRVQALTSYRQDYRNVLELAVHCVLEGRKPAFEHHPWKLAASNHLIDCYLGIDSLGYAEQIREALDYLEEVIEPGPNSHRYVMTRHKRQFALDREALDEARSLALEVLALTDADDEGHRSRWFALPCLLDLAWIAWRQGDWESVAGQVDQAEGLAPRVDQSQAEMAEAQVWQAVLCRRAGEEEGARRYTRAAAGRMSRLRSPAGPRYYDVLSLFFELGGDLERVVKVRDRELEGIADRGRLAYECDVLTKRLKALTRAGRLEEADIAAVRAAAGKLRKPEPYLAKIEAAVKG
jgi:hypothetical protein